MLKYIVSIIIFMIFVIGILIFQKINLDINLNIKFDNITITKSFTGDINFENIYAIIPHFMINSKKVDEFYGLIKSKIFLNGNIENSKINIVLISPNHFGLGTKQFESFCDKSIKKICYKKNCINGQNFDNSQIFGCGNGKDDFFESDYLFRLEKGFYSTNEHGIGEHFYYLDKYFSGANFHFFVINSTNFNNLETLKTYFEKNFSSNTIFVGSIDFSHYIDEEFAKLHDKKTIYTLNNSTSINDFMNVEVDCKTCLYLINLLAQNKGQTGKLWFRDSSSDILGKNLGFENTSRNFILFEKINSNIQLENGITIAFFGDLIYDRGVLKNLSGQTLLGAKFKDFFQQGDISNDPKYFYHRKLFGIDFVGLNLETPIVKSKDICQKSSKTIAFCSDYNILPFINKIGFNIVNIANNHSMDGGINAHNETIKNLGENDIGFFGYIKHGKYFEQNYIYSGEIRGIKYAWHGFDFTITKTDFGKYCDNLSGFKNKGFLNFVSVHFGNEYQQIHSLDQELISHKLIDCGADFIIGHHPHVIQDIGYYNGKPIIYSLGNFLFDQGFSSETKKGMYVLIDINKNGNSKILTGTINSYIK